MGLPVLVTLVTTGLLALASAEPREQFVFRLLSVFQAGPDLPENADRDKNGQISESEFLQSLFLFTDEKRDRQVTQAEFVDGYRRQFGLPSELLVIMFDLLDDLNDDGGGRKKNDVRDNRNNKFFDLFSQFSPDSGMFSNNKQQHGDNILTSRDVTIRQFMGDNKRPSKDDYRKSLMKWVAAAADRLYTINYQPHIPGNPWDMEFDYERWFNSIDRNNDSLISFNELRDEFRRYNPDGRVRRSRWVERNLKQFGDREWLATVVFDYWDKNKDLRLDEMDAGLILKEADRNRDMRVTTIEFHRFMEKYNKRARRRLATPIRPVIYDCPSPWWQSMGCRPRVDATRAAMDMDDNFDGWITQGELRKRVSYYDRNGDGWASRMEVMMLESMRYGVKGPTAKVMFDIYDRNGDGRYDNKDLQLMLSGGRVLCFCDARRAVLDLVRLSEKFKNSPQTQGPVGSLRNAMRWYMTREWRWRQQAEQLWNRIWGQGGGPGGGCREGDCTGKDWRGGAWYSPFDWRQKNRVPENFLQWSYLRNIPRTVFFPQNFGADGGEQFLPGGGRNWWNPQWPKGNDWYGGGNQNPGGSASDGNRGGGFSFPPRVPGTNPGSGQFPSNSRNFVPIPRDFMPNPSNLPKRPDSFSRTSSSLPFNPTSFPASSAAQELGDDKAEEFWNRLITGFGNGTVSGNEPAWVEPDANMWQQMFNKGGAFPWLMQPKGETQAKNDEDWSWMWKQGVPSRQDNFENGEADSRGAESNFHFNMGEEPDQVLTSEDHNRDNSAGNRGSRRGRPILGGSRFRRDIDDDKPTSTSDLPPPPSPTAQTNITDSGNFTSNATESENNSTLPQKDAHSNTVTANDKLSRALGRSRNPFYDRSWLAVGKDLSNCEDDEPWIQQNDNSMGWRDWGSQPDNWGSQGAGWPVAGEPDTTWADNQQTQPYGWNGYRNGFPGQISRTLPRQWWTGLNRYSDGPWGSPRGDFSGSRGNYFNPWDGMPQPGQRHLRRRSTEQLESVIDQDKISRRVGIRSDLGLPSNKRNDFNYYNGFGNSYHGFSSNNYQPQWWNWNKPNSWTPTWRNYGSRDSFYPGKHNFFMPQGNQDFSTPIRGQHVMYRRSADNPNENGGFNNGDKVGKWMENGHYRGHPPYGRNNFNNFNSGFHQPQWWNMWNNQNSQTHGNGWGSPVWGRGNEWGSPMWRNFDNSGTSLPGNTNFYESSGNERFGNPMASWHTVSRRSADNPNQKENSYDNPKIGNWMGDGFSGYSPHQGNNFNNRFYNYNSYQPQWWNMWNNEYSWPQNNRWNSNHMWRNYGNWDSFFPGDSNFYNRRGNQGFGNPMGSQHHLYRRSADNLNQKESSQDGIKVSNQIGNRHFGGHTPYSRNNFESRIYDYTNYQPQWWSMRNNQNSWTLGNSWNSPVWETYGSFFPKNSNLNSRQGNRHLNTPWGSQHVYKRSADGENEDTADDTEKVARWMRGEDVGYFSPHLRNSFNNYNSNGLKRYNYWPLWWNSFNPRQVADSWRSNQRWGNYRSQITLPTTSYFYLTPRGRQGSHAHAIFRRSTKSQQEYGNDEVSRMMGGYGGYWPQWWNMRNSYRYRPGYGNNWMWNNYYPFYFAKDGIQEESDKEHLILKRSTDDEEKDQISRMMSGYGGHWPWHGNSYRYSPRQNNWIWHNNWMRNGYGNYHPHYYSQRRQNFMNQHFLSKRNAGDKTEEDEVSRMMGGYGGYWPQWWNMWNSYRYWPRWNNWMSNNYRNYYPFYFSKGDQNPLNQHMRLKRNAEEQTENQDISRMMSGYGGYWPHGWNMWNSYRHWPRWNNWMWNSYSPFYFAKDEDKETSEKEHIISKRSTDSQDKDKVSRMMGGYGGYWPQWWNMWNSYRHWPRWNNWMGNNYRNYYPFYFSKGDQNPLNQHMRLKRNAEEQTENQDISRMMGANGGYWPYHWNNHGYSPRQNNWMWNSNSMWNGYGNYNPYYYSQGRYNFMNQPFRSKRNAEDDTEEDKVSRMMGGYGGHWPHWWYYRGYYNGYWNNWRQNNRMWNSYSPFYFAKDEDKETSEREHILSKRSTGSQDKDPVSRMMGGYGGYWPQWWNMWNSYGNWPRWNNWMSNNYRNYYQFYFSKGDQNPLNQHMRLKRNAEQKTENQDISRMMDGYGGYWPQGWNMWNQYNYWPGYGNNWMGSSYYPFHFAKETAEETSDKEHILSKRSTDSEDKDEVSRMMGGYGGYWPQWWNMWNSYRYWPRWNNWMGNNYRNYYPFYFSKGDQNPLNQHMRLKRNAEEKTESQDISRMMGGNGGYWPYHWNNHVYSPRQNNWMQNSNSMWNGYGNYNPYYYSQGRYNFMNQPFRSKRNAEDDTEEDNVSRMMGGYGGHWPHWWYYRGYWNGYWNNWMQNNRMWNSYSPFYFAKDGDKETSEKEHILSKRSIDSEDKDQVSRMMGGYGGYWPQWSNMWNSYRYWPRWNNWMSNNYRNYYPFYFSNGDQTPLNQHMRLKRTAEEQTENQDISRMMGGYGGFWPQGWNMWNSYRHWPRWNNWMWNSYSPFYFAKDEDKETSDKEHFLSKRSTDNEDKDEVSRMMGGYGGYGGYWPQGWNMWNQYTYWPGYGNNWMGSSHYPFHFAKEKAEETSDKEHILSKRSTDSEDKDDISRMMGSNGYWPQGWNNWNSYRQGPRWNNWMSNNYRNYYPFFFSQEGQSPMNQHMRLKRNVEEQTENQDISRMMGGYGGYWPQWWNMWNYYRYRPGYGNNWMWNNYYPFYFAKSGDEEMSKREHILSKRSTDNQDKDEVSRMVGGYGGYWPYHWNNHGYSPKQNNWMQNSNSMWNGYGNYNPYYYSQGRYNFMNQPFRSKRNAEGNTEEDKVSRMMGGYGGHWPHWWYHRGYWNGYWNNWMQNNWMWNSYSPFYFAKDGDKETSEKEHILSKRSTGSQDKDEVSRMMGGYGGYWPQWWNMWNSYRYWPRWNNWMGNNYRNNYPFYFSKGNQHPFNQHMRLKRNAEQKTENQDISRMMGGYGGYWPQGWNMWNSYRHWPRWNNRMWNSYSPFYFAKDEDKEPSEKEHILSKRNTGSQDKDEVSRMMGGYGGYWPQGWNMWNQYTYWPGYGNNWMGSSHYPFHFAKEKAEETSDKEHILSKRSTDSEDKDDISRMMGSNGYWPQGWNNWNSYRQGPRWNNWMSNNYRNYYPFFFSQEGQSPMNQHMRLKRNVEEQTENQDISRMMGGYGGYWPQWWNMWNNYRYWPGYGNNWMWNNYYPFYFAKNGDEEMSEKEHILSKRSTDNQDKDQVSRMMGGYGGYWPYHWNNHGYSPKQNNWVQNSNSMWNGYGNYNPYYYSQGRYNFMNQPFRSKRNAEDDTEEDKVSRMMDGYGGHWPQWWYHRGYWNGYWNNWRQNNWMWNSYSPFYFAKDEDKETSEKEHILSKRSTESEDKDQVSRMMGGYGGYRPQWWNMWNSYRYWPRWNNWMGNNYRNNYPFYFSQEGKNPMNQHMRLKRNVEEKIENHDVSRMMGGYGGYWPHWGNMWNRYWPHHWNKWMWNNYYSFNTNEGIQKISDTEHLISKRSSSERDEDHISRMMGGYRGYWPQQWNQHRYWPWYRNSWMWNGYGSTGGSPHNIHIFRKRSADLPLETDERRNMMGSMWNNYRYWPRWMWNFFRRTFPFYSQEELKFNPGKEHLLTKRSTQKVADKLSRMMNSNGGYWPQWWNTWNSFRYWPNHWNNWMSNSYYPFYFAKDEQQETSEKEHIISKRSTDSQDKDEMSRMMGGYGGYWPQGWNMWPGYWNKWMWNDYYPFYFAKDEDQEQPVKEHHTTKRSTQTQEAEMTSRMMNGYRGHWPQWWNMWNNFRYWPGYWNNWMHKNWMWNHYNPFNFANDAEKDTSEREHILSKRSIDSQDKDQVSRMMGGYGGYWPQWWNMWNSYRNWPRWNNWMWNSYSPFYFAKDEDKETSEKEHILSKRSTDSQDKDEVSRMMGGYGGYWPQGWNTWNSRRGGRNDWMWNRFNSPFPFPSHYFSNNAQHDNYQHHVLKRSAEEQEADALEDEQQIAKMMDSYGYRNSHQPSLWNMQNNYGFWPGYWNNKNNWNWNDQRQEGNNWNSYNWMTNKNHPYFPYNSFYYSQLGDGDHPPSSYSQQRPMWSVQNFVDNFRSFAPFAFAQEAETNSKTSTGLDEQREKRSTDSVEETSEGNTDTNATDGAASKSEPDIARQLSGHGQSDGNLNQQQLRKLYRSYLKSRPRYWSNGYHGDTYGDPHISLYWNQYGSIYGRYYYVTYSMLWRAYRFWYRQMWNNRMWNRYYPAWNYYIRSAPYFYTRSMFVPSSNPPIRHQTGKTVVTEKAEEENEEETTINDEEMRAKRSTGSMNHHSHWPSWWGYGMYNYNHWPWWNFYTYSPMWNNYYNWNHGNWMWSGYNRPFMYSQQDDASAGKATEQMDDNTPTDSESSAAGEAARNRDRRSTGDDQKSDLRSALSSGNNQNEMMPSLMGENHWNRGQGEMFNSFPFGSMDGNGWNRDPMQGLNMNPNGWNENRYHNNVWSKMGSFGPLAFATGNEDTAKRTRNKLQKRSVQVENRAKPDGSNPRVSRWMRSYSRILPMMRTSLSSWPAGMGRRWQFRQYNSQQQWMNWNSWGRSHSWNNWNSAYSSSFQDFPFSYYSTDDTVSAKKIREREKRSVDDATDDEKTDAEAGTENADKISRMGGEYGRFFPMRWNNYRPRFINNGHWTRYNWPMFNFYNSRPRWSSRNHWNQYQYGPGWNQNQYSPSWNWYQYRPSRNWGNGEQMQAVNYRQNFNNKADNFHDEYVDESVFDPLSSYYFAMKDASTDGADEERVDKSSADKSPATEDKISVDSVENPRSKRSLASFAKVLSKGRGLSSNLKFHKTPITKIHKRFAKTNIPFKVKRFSSEAKERLQKRFMKRSPTSSTNSAPAQPETAPKPTLRATAPARGQSTRNREWGPPRGGGFPQNPGLDPRNSNRNRNPNQVLSPNRDSGQNPDSVSGQGMDFFGNYQDMDDWNWQQPGLDGRQNWFGQQGPGQTAPGQGAGGTQEEKGSGDSSDKDTATTTHNSPTDSTVDGDPNSRLGNYNYIDTNNPNYWNQFYNPDSYNVSDGDPLGNSSQWDSWFGLWAYGPNFWDDMDDLDLWDAPSWGPDPWSQRGGNWWLGPDTRYNTVPTEVGWERHWLDDCDDDGYGGWRSPENGLRPRNVNDWWDPDWARDVSYGQSFGNPPYRGCRNCFRPYSNSFRLYQQSFRPSRYPFRPDRYASRPARSPFRPVFYSFRPSRPFFRPYYGPTGTSSFGSVPAPAVAQAYVWLTRFPRHNGPWNVNGLAHWLQFPWWEWNANSFWNPWRYRVQYHSDLGGKVSRSRRSTPDGLNPPAPATAAVHKRSAVAAVNKLAPASGAGSKNQGPVNSPPVNKKGVFAPKRSPPPNKVGPYANPGLVGSYYPNDNADGGFKIWNLDNLSRGRSTPMGDVWSGLPWWDKNNWYVDNARDHPLPSLGGTGTMGGTRNDFRGIPGSGGGNMGNPLKIFSRFPGHRNVPGGFGRGGVRVRGNWSPAPPNFPAQTGFGGQATPWKGGNFFRSPGGSFHRGSMRREGPAAAGSPERSRSESWQPMNRQSPATPPTPWNPIPWNRGNVGDRDGAFWLKGDHSDEGEDHSRQDSLSADVEDNKPNLARLLGSGRKLS